MERIKNKRAARRAQSTKIVNEVKEILQSGQFELSALRVLQSRLKATRSELNVLNAELEAVMTDEQVIEDYDSVMEYDEAAVCALALLEHNIDMLKTSSSLPTTEPPPAADGNRPTEPSTITTRSQREFGARLPKLELLRFDGTITQWQPFWDMFLHSVYENARLSDTDRFHYLVSLLDGAAAKAVARIQGTESSYSQTSIYRTRTYRIIAYIERFLYHVGNRMHF